MAHMLPIIIERAMRKRDYCLSENKGADQLCSDCTADQRLCFRYTDSTIPSLLVPKLRESSFLQGPVFSRRGSYRCR